MSLQYCYCLLIEDFWQSAMDKVESLCKRIFVRSSLQFVRQHAEDTCFAGKKLRILLIIYVTF